MEKRVLDSLQYLVAFQKPGLVFGASAEDLTKEISQLTGLTVHLVDFRNRTWPQLPDRMTKICEEGGIALIAFDASTDTRRFAPLLRDLLQRQGWAKQLDFNKVILMISTSARLLDEIDGWQSLEDILRLLTWVYAGVDDDVIVGEGKSG
jgi:hypothetical protein